MLICAGYMALSTATPQYDQKSKQEIWKVLPKWRLDPVFKAAVEATEEAIINALVAAEDLEGINGNKWFAIPHDRIREILKKYSKLQADIR